MLFHCTYYFAFSLFGPNQHSEKTNEIFLKVYFWERHSNTVLLIIITFIERAHSEIQVCEGVKINYAGLNSLTFEKNIEFEF